MLTVPASAHDQLAAHARPVAASPPEAYARSSSTEPQAAEHAGFSSDDWGAAASDWGVPVAASPASKPAASQVQLSESTAASSPFDFSDLANELSSVYGNLPGAAPQLTQPPARRKDSQPAASTCALDAQAVASSTPSCRLASQGRVLPEFYLSFQPEPRAKRDVLGRVDEQHVAHLLAEYEQQYGGMPQVSVSLRTCCVH